MNPVKSHRGMEIKHQHVCNSTDITSDEIEWTRLQPPFAHTADQFVAQQAGHVGCVSRSNVRERDRESLCF